MPCINNNRIIILELENTPTLQTQDRGIK
jgi:hypothetical protein